MGLLTDFVIKNPKIKFWLPIVLDILLIAGLVFFALTIKGQIQTGFDMCRKQACAICLVDMMSQNTSTTNITEIPENFTMFGNNT